MASTTKEKKFFCELCSKGYDRINEFETHEVSYDHQHRKRLKDLKQLTKDPNAAARAREAEARMNEEAGLKSVSVSLPSSTATGTTKKKPVFKSTLQPQNASAVPAKPLEMMMGKGGTDANDLNKAIANGWADDQYEPTNVMPYAPNFRLTDIMSEDDLREMDTEITQRRHR